MKKIRIGIAGLGVVGTGLIEILQSQSERFEQARIGFDVTGIVAKDQSKDRGVDLSGMAWFNNPIDLAKSETVDVFVELIGGSEGVALEAVSQALSSGKHVVTANKALLAEHGVALAKIAEEKGVSLCYEASVAGGIPAVRSLRTGTSASEISKIVGILNGTCNYILTEMSRTGASYDQALSDAQALGYAEADPTFDVEGVDAAHKLAIAATLAFNRQIEFGSFPIQGISQISSEDIRGAERLGYKIKLLAVTERKQDGCDLRVHPALVQENHALAKAEGADNFILVQSDPLGEYTLAGPGACQSDPLGEYTLAGPGAGKGPTATAVAADLVAIARGARGPVFSVPSSNLAGNRETQNIMAHARFFLRLTLKDEPGAIAAISEILATHDISIDSMLQPSVSARKETPETKEATLVITTHMTTAQEIRAATDEMSQKSFALGSPSIIRIEDFDIQN